MYTIVIEFETSLHGTFHMKIYKYYSEKNGFPDRLLWCSKASDKSEAMTTFIATILNTDNSRNPFHIGRQTSKGVG